MARVALPRIGQVLEERHDRVNDNLEKAASLKAEAEGVAEAYEATLADARAEEILKESLKRRERTALERIAQAETRTLDAVRGLAIDIAIDATRRVLAETVTDKKAHALVADAIKELPKKLN